MTEGSPILTLEPLIEAVREGVEGAGWYLSGLQKTTSHHFEGRWEGDSTRSAYLFFHNERWDDASVDVFLDETTRGLTGNLALVVDGPRFGLVGTASRALSALGSAAGDCMPPESRTPITLRLRLDDAGSDPEGAHVEVRFKLRLPVAAFNAGASSVSSLATQTVRCFELLMEHETVRALLTGPGRAGSDRRSTA